MNSNIETTKKLLDKHFKRSKKSRVAIGISTKTDHYDFSYNDNSQDLLQESFGLGSISKTFLGSYLAKCIKEEKINLDDTLDKYIKLENKYIKYPTIQQLASHTSGYSFFIPRVRTLSSMLFNGFNRKNIYRNIDKNWVYQYLEKKDPSKNKKYRYSDFNYAVLAYIIESIKGENIRVLMNDYFKNEIHLENTYYGTYDSTSKDKYSWTFKDNNPFLPSGGVFSNIKDMLKFLEFQMNETEYLDISHQKYHKTNRDNIFTGFSWNSFKNGHFYWHIGGQGYYRSYSIFDKKRKIAVVILSTVDINLIHIGRLGSFIYRNAKRNHHALIDFFDNYELMT
jgi:CubicO group peptidase (beta-lactamase class C family)